MKYVSTLLLTLLLSAGALAAEDTDFSAKIRAIPTQLATVNGVDIAYKRIGSDQDPVVMLIMGLGATHLLWGDELTHRLVGAGYQVVLFDNRDVGESQRFDAHGEPTLWWEFLKLQIGFEVNAAYDLSDMALDAVGLMDVLEIERAHVVGASMGGMIAQVVAARHPDRTLSLTSIMSTPGFGDHLPAPGNQVNDIMEEDEESEEERLKRLNFIGIHPQSMPRQIMAILKSGDRAEEVKTISVPTLILHGEDDTLIPPQHGEYTAELIQGSRYVSFEGMGHNLPAAVLPDLLGHMLAHMSAGTSQLMAH